MYLSLVELTARYSDLESRFKCWERDIFNSTSLHYLGNFGESRERKLPKFIVPGIYLRVWRLAVGLLRGDAKCGYCLGVEEGIPHSTLLFDF